MVAASSPDPSVGFRNLQELLQQVSAGPVVPVRSAGEEETVVSTEFPRLSVMAAQLHHGEISSTLEPASEHEPEPPEPEIIAPWAPQSLPLEESTPMGLTQTTETIAHEVMAAEVWDDADWEERGVGLVIGGAILILLALGLACTIPAAWVQALQVGQEARPEYLSLAWLQTWLGGVPALALAATGVGSFRRRRWAVPLVHAGGWFVALCVLMGLAVLSAGFFFIGPASGQVERSQGMAILRLLLGLGVFGLIIPLILIAIYQRRYLPQLCRKADARDRWTDGLPEPLLMLWLGCWWAGLLVGSLLLVGGVFPLGGQLLGGAGGWLLTGIFLLGFGTASVLVAKRIKLGWWLAAGLFTALTSCAAATFWVVPWEEILRIWGLPGDGATGTGPSRLAALVAVALYVPQLLVLIMSRGCFPKAEEEEDEEKLAISDA